jgi:Subtilase family
MAAKNSKRQPRRAGTATSSSSSSTTTTTTTTTTSGGNSLAAPPELIVVARQDVGLRASAGRFASMAGAPTRNLASLLSDHGARLRPIFGATEERAMAALSAFASAESMPAQDLSVFYSVEAPPERLEALRSDLAGDELVEAAYIKPGAEPAAYINDMAPTAEEAPPASPDFTSRQTYLDAAPGGVEARWAWTQAGGRGAGIKVIDIEGAWRFTHEDLTGNQGGVVGGTQSADIRWRNHGTAVLGEFSGDQNGFGVTGIASDANASAISIFGAGNSSSAALAAAAAKLGAGDVLLIELHRPGPRFNFAGRDDQRGYIAIEWWPDDFAAIVAAVAKGIIVVEAAGNGAENLDDAIYQNPAPGFPAGWTNPFRRSNRDSGAIMVGAGAPPPGTHGRSHGADRSRLDFSNWGALIDAQGWGREVTTCGYGDLQGGTNEDLWYTDTFSGTSSASPIVVGVAASLQGIVRVAGRPPLTPAQFRNCLRTTGSAQQDEPGRPATQRIGNRPNLRQLVACAIPKPKEKDGKDIKEKDFKDVIKDIKEKDKKDIKEKEKKEFKDKDKDFKDIKEKDKKDIKDKEKKEFKDKDKEKDIKDIKDKEKEKDKKDIKDKDIKEFKEGKEFDNILKGDLSAADGGGGTGGGAVEERLAAVEAALASLVHFIGGELRPDLTANTLGAQGQGLSEEEAQAKSWKDQKDSEAC